MLRYNPQYHQQADHFVQQTGNWEFTVYMGHYREWEDDQIVNDWLAFMPMHNDSRHYVEGLPIYVLVNETDIRFTDVSECFKVLDQVSINDHYAKGRRIFRKMEQQYWADDFANAKEREYVREIIQVMRGHFDEPIEDNDMYLFLQESKRLNRRIKIVPDKQANANKLDAWSYYLTLV